jgi:arabinofuranosyltransferase
MTPSPRRSRILLGVALSLFAIVLLRNAWVGDDAYIGLRTVKNFVNGDGLTWNVTERVQAYTCPLWILLNCAVFYVTREAYFTTIFLSLAVSVLAVVVMWRTARGDTQALFGLAILLCSKAFMDYSTSGLENPLTHLLLAVFVAVYFRDDGSLKSLFWLTLIAALAVTNRMDVAVLLAPPAAYAFYRARGLRAVGVVLLASTPFLLWEAFSLFYYGFPFPNTAYAKLGTGIGAWETARQGAYYFRNSLSLDPLTLPVIGGGLLAPLVSRRWRELPLALGTALYLAYVLKVGGDFMSGRFFSAPLIFAVCLLGHVEFSPHSVTWAVSYAAVLFVGLIAPGAPLLSGEHYHTLCWGTGPDDRGIADERGCYYPCAGLLPTWRHGGGLRNDWVEIGRDARARGLPVVVRGNIGYFGYYADRDVYILDPGALSDPFLARLPAARTPEWRVGHFVRVLPEGYVETLRTGENRLADRRLAQYREKLSLVVSGPLFDANRLREIWRLNTGAYDHLIDAPFYRSAAPPVRTYSELSRTGAPAEVTYFGPNGIEIDCEGRTLSRELEVSLDNNDHYRIIFLRGDAELARVRVMPPEPPLQVGLHVYRVEVPAEAGSNECDRIRIVPVPFANDGSCGVGHVRFVD